MAEGFCFVGEANKYMNFNRAIIVGRLTRDPELRTTPSGQQVCNFSVATSRIWNDPDTRQRQEKTEFHNVVAWRRLAEIAGQYLNKGALVLVEGRIETRSWEDQQTGTRKYRTEIIAENMQLGPRSSNLQNNGRQPASSAQQHEDTLPSAQGRHISNENQDKEQVYSPQEDIPTIESDTPF